jgi:hypothetical protein
MWRRTFTLLTFLLCAVAFAQTATYSNPAARFAIDYPNGWVAREGVFGATVMILRPNPSGFSTNLNVIVSRVGSQVTLEGAEQEIIRQLTEVVTDFKLVSQQRTTLAGQTAIATLSTGRQGRYNLVWYQLIALREGLSYTVTFTVEASAYESERVPLGNILGTFRFL